MIVSRDVLVAMRRVAEEERFVKWLEEELGRARQEVEGLPPDPLLREAAARAKVLREIHTAITEAGSILETK